MTSPTRPGGPEPRAYRLRRSGMWFVPVVFAVLAVTMAGPSAIASGPGFTLSPSQGSPNSTVSFAGSGFCGTPSCGTVTVTFSNAPVADGIPVSPGGQIKGAFDVPFGPAGWQRVVASQSGAGLSATALFYVTTGQPPAKNPGPTVTFIPPAASTRPAATAAVYPAAPPASRAPNPTPASTSPPTPTNSSATPLVAAPATHQQAADATRWPWVLLIAAGIVALAVVSLVTRRRSRQRTKVLHG